MKRLQRIALALGLSWAASCSSGGGGTLSTAQITTYCVAFSSCPQFGDMGGGQLSDCILEGESFVQAPGSAREFSNLIGPCLSSSQSCDALVSCLGANHGSAYCATHANTSCDGDVLVDCNSASAPSAHDCTTDGEHCHSDGNGSALCATNTTCDPASTPSSCTGTVRNRCMSLGTSGFVQTLDCANLGLPGYTCGAAAGGMMDCTPPPSATVCAGNEPTCADATTLVLCDDAGETISSTLGLQVRVNCASLYSGGRCDPNGAGSGDALCVPGTNSCAGMDSCDGASIVYCSGGQTTRYDCSQFGFTTCRQVTGAAPTCF